MEAIKGVKDLSRGLFLQFRHLTRSAPLPQWSPTPRCAIPASRCWLTKRWRLPDVLTPSRATPAHISAQWWPGSSASSVKFALHKANARFGTPFRARRNEPLRDNENLVRPVHFAAQIDIVTEIGTVNRLTLVRFRSGSRAACNRGTGVHAPMRKPKSTSSDPPPPLTLES